MRACLLLSLWSVGQCWGAWGSSPPPTGRGGGGGHSLGEQVPVLGGGSQGFGRGGGGYNSGGNNRGGGYDLGGTSRPGSQGSSGGGDSSGGGGYNPGGGSLLSNHGGGGRSNPWDNPGHGQEYYPWGSQDHPGGGSGGGQGYNFGGGGWGGYNPGGPVDCAAVSQRLEELKRECAGVQTPGNSNIGYSSCGPASCQLACSPSQRCRQTGTVCFSSPCCEAWTCVQAGPPADSRCPRIKPDLRAPCRLPGVECPYGKECCCGSCHPSMLLSCTASSITTPGEWIGLHTEACMGADCGAFIPSSVFEDQRGPAPGTVPVPGQQSPGCGAGYQQYPGENFCCDSDFAPARCCHAPGEEGNIRCS